MNAFLLLSTLNLSLGGLVFLFGFLILRENPGQRLNRVVAVLPGPGGRVEPVLAAELKRAERARRGGPEGWNDAVLTILAGRRLPTASPEARRGDDCPLVFEPGRRTA